MPDLAANLTDTVGGFPIAGRMMRYSQFVPRLYNLCRELGFRPGRMLPSRAFCSDESQGYPIILLAKHFGAFPFNHGRVGGVVSLDRHGPHADHGDDLILIQASHVGYDPEARQFGPYRRLQTEPPAFTPTCGKIGHLLEWYQAEYDFAREGIALHRDAEGLWVTLDNQLLRTDRAEGLILRLERMIAGAEAGSPMPARILSTAKRFAAHPELPARLTLAGALAETPQPAQALSPELFHFRHAIAEGEEGQHHLEHNLIRFMPYVLTARAPMLMAAQLNTQVEFDRTFRSIVKAHAYRGKRLFFISGLHIDISPQPGQVFPLTKFVPWAAYLQEPDGGHRILEQDELVSALRRMPSENPHEMDLEAAIGVMAQAREVRIDWDAV